MSNTTIQVFPTAVNNPLGLMRMLEEGLGKENYPRNISPHITPERFQLTSPDVREVNLELAPFLAGETAEAAVRRLAPKGYNFENTGELAAFLADKPEEVAKYAAVVTLGDLSRWVTKKQFGQVFVPYVQVNGAYRCCRLYPFNTRFYSAKDRILVSRGEVK